MFRNRGGFFGVCFVLVMVFGAVLSAADIKILFITGENNHDWAKTTDYLEKMYEESGMFSVDITKDPYSIDADMLKEFDVIVNNWTIVGKSGHVWGADTEKAIEEFVAGGKGFVTFHAGSSCFGDWKAFHEMVGGTWGAGTGHGPYHEFTVEVTDKEHPITKGMSDFAISDELWHRIEVKWPVDSRKAICKAFSVKDKGGSGNMEDVAICTNYGKGRGFYLVLGHDAKALSNAGLRMLMLRATEWAATGEVTIRSAVDPDVLLEAVSRYDYGQKRDYLLAAEQLSQSVAGDAAQRSKLAGKYAKMLGGDVSLECKKFLCWQLSLVGGDEQVEQLAQLLGDKELGIHVQNTLKRIGGEPASKAIRAKLSELDGAALAGAISVAGDLRDKKAVKQISGFLYDDDMDVARAAMSALGGIGGKDAVAGLKNCLQKVKDGLVEDVWQGQLKCAEGFASVGEVKDASNVYSDVLENGKGAGVRMAGFIGLCGLQRDGGGKMVVDAFSGSDELLREASLIVLRSSGAGEAGLAAAKGLGEYPSGVQVTVINALADTGNRTAADAIGKAVDSGDEQVRLAAIGAVGKLGSGSSVSVLMRLMKKGSGREADMAREALVWLVGADVDRTMISQLSSSDAAVSRDLIDILARRGSSEAIGAIGKMTASADAGIRNAAINALGSLGNVDALGVLVASLARSSDGDDVKAVEKSMMSIGRVTQHRNKAVEIVAGGLDGMNDAGKVVLLRVLGTFGGEKALAAISEAAGDKNKEIRMTAIRTMSNWSDASPMMDLLTAASNADNSIERIVALRGFAKMSNMAENVDNEKVVASFAKILANAENTTEKKELLKLLGQIYSVEALRLVETLLDEKEISSEASVAAVNISGVVWRWHKEYVAGVLKKAMVVNDSEAVSKQANAILSEMDKPVNFAIGGKASSPDGLEKDGGSAGDGGANDGDMETYWDEEDNQELYRYKLSFPEDTLFTLIKITGFSHHGYSPKDFDVVCDGKVVKTVRQAVYDNNVLNLNFDRTKCRTLELKITSSHGPSPAMRELEIYNGQ